MGVMQDLHPADDDEPITREWIAGNWPMTAEALGLECCEQGGGGYAIYVHCDDCDDSNWLRTVTTRGDVRAFLRGMGLSMKCGEK